MNTQLRLLILTALSFLTLAACSPGDLSESVPSGLEPLEIIDLGALVTEDLPERVWGKGFLVANGFTSTNEFEIIDWHLEMENGSVSGSNAYYTLFNHGGPHVDAPKHVGVGGGLDSYPINTFIGPLKVFDARRFPKGRSVPVDLFKGSVGSGDVVLIYTGYTPPQNDEAFPETITLTCAAAEYLASLPIRAFGTDSWSVASLDDKSPVEAEAETARALPIHYSFLSRGIPIYEQLFNVDDLLDEESMYFVGVPLNIKNGDGMVVRPVVFVY